MDAHISILNKIAKIEALIQRGASEGERAAALLAKERLMTKIARQEDEIPIEYKVSTDSTWKKRLFTAICSKHGLSTYRYHRQKYTTTQVRVSKAIMDMVLWPEYQRHVGMLGELVEEILQELIVKIHQPDEKEVVIMGEIIGHGPYA